MIPVLDAKTIREADAYTIENEPIASIELMERASQAFVKKFVKVASESRPVVVFAGRGNNGGDALAIARILIARGYEVTAYVVGSVGEGSEDFQTNYKRLQLHAVVHLVTTKEQIPTLDSNQIVIDGLLGSGLSRSIAGLYKDLVHSINASGAFVVSVDMPSGVFTDLPLTGDAIQSNYTISFQVPKLAFFQPSLAEYVGKWQVEDIGLHADFLRDCTTDYCLTALSDIQVPVRSRYDHKGTAGRLLLISGSKGKMGAATLSARAAMRSGCGLLLIHSPCCGLDILQINVPEAMVICDEHDEVVTEIIPEESIDVIAIGPGLGTGVLTRKALENLLHSCQKPLILDADALNILAMNRYLLDVLPEESILTPHPGEFKRLVGDWSDDFEKLEKLKAFCKQYHVNVVLKGAFSAVCNRFGVVHFNPTGNPGMATAGSGDVLTGIVAALRTQGLFPFEALKTGVYIHGLAGDLASQVYGEVSLIASDIIQYLPQAFGLLYKRIADS